MHGLANTLTNLYSTMSTWSLLSVVTVLGILLIGFFLYKLTD